MVSEANKRETLEDSKLIKMERIRKIQTKKLVEKRWGFGYCIYSKTEWYLRMGLQTRRKRASYSFVFVTLTPTISPT